MPKHRSQTEAKTRNKRIYQLNEELRANGYVGDDLQAEVERRLRLHPMDGGTFRRCVRLGKALVEEENAAKPFSGIGHGTSTSRVRLLLTIYTGRGRPVTFHKSTPRG